MSLTIATTLGEALAALDAGARPIAGGSDLVVGARQGKAPLPSNLVAIDRLPELSTIEESGVSLFIGAGITHAELMTHPTIVAKATAIADASALVGSPSTRNVGTLGGNVMNGSPAMDTGAPLMVLGALAHLQSANAERTVALEDLWLAPGQTSANDNELCVGLTMPVAPPQSGSAYVRLEYRRAMEIAVVGAAAAVTLEGDTIGSVRVALTAVAPTIVEVTGLHSLLGLSVAEAAQQIRDIASQQAAPISDLRASDKYRRHTVGVMAGRALDAAARRAAGETIAVPVNRALGVGATA